MREFLRPWLFLAKPRKVRRIHRDYADESDSPRILQRHFRAARAYQAIDKPEGATKDIKEAIRLDLKTYAAATQDGPAKKSAFEHVMDDYVAAIAIDPNDAEFHAGRTELTGQDMVPDDAIADYSEAIRLSPNDATLLVKRGDLWQKKRMYSNAVNNYAAAIRLDPKLADAYAKRAFAFCEYGNPADGIKYCTEAIGFNPKFVNLYAI